VFQATNEILDFASADVRLNQIHWGLIPQSPVSGGEPLERDRSVTFEKVDGQTKNPGSAQQAVRFFRLQPTFCLATNEGSTGNVNQLAQGAEGKLRLSGESVEYRICETGPDRSCKGQRVRLAKPQKDAGVTMGLPESLPKRMRLRHMALY
jgi:hypothetical protein